MPSATAVSTLVIGMFVTGCANSLLSKYQDMECVENCDPGSPHSRVDFEQPVWQTLNMFVGEFLCCLPIIWSYFSDRHSSSKIFLGEEADYGSVPQDDLEVDQQPCADDELSGWRLCWMWFPALFDICGTTLMNTGLLFLPVSIYQMCRGALVLWVGILSVIFLGRRLWLYQWVSLVIVTLGVCLVGLSGSLVKKELSQTPGQGAVAALIAIGKREDDDPAKIIIGVSLILFAQIFTASQYVVEEKIMSRYKVAPLAAVSLEGFFGLVTTLAAMPFLHIFLHDKSPYFDIPRGWKQIITTPTVLGSCFAIMVSIGAFNFFGLSVTSRVSATTRSTIDTCRTLGIWVASLALGWEKIVFPFSLLQVAGFAMLVYGTFVFNGLVAPMCCPPPPSVHLPHEPELEETGELPAAQAQGRSGYDVVPERFD